ncbi:hypothetical protein OPKNFCMD_1211 [Methylobacterium crusticola]|uniref:AsmA domain-containing protein n=1 Tax=Methylobacterium crusticola TaxID=1697972 RepID=A0ABQ4QUP3_9HYPH|nr:AsmA-like C-terminal region-containing protein [Methylobacterium crusticola]GJD48490.1 hypothetical protein OPKNFCMD_1211 [Methylobacterium crusticola]
MSRRSTLVLCGGVSALVLAASSLSWTLATPRAAAFVGRDLARRYGLSLEAAGTATVTLLPAPRLTFREARLRHDGQTLVESEGLQVQLGLGGLLAGRPEVTGVTLDRARIALPDGGGWGEPVDRLAARLAAGQGRHLRRLVLAGATVTGRDPRTGAVERATDVNLVAAWPRPSAGLDLSGTFTWRGVPATVALAGLRPGDLATEAGSPFSAALTWAAGSLELDGIASWRDGPHLAGRGRLATRALPETLAWLGAEVPLGPLAGPFGLDGRFEARPGAVEWPSLRVRAGDNTLEGAGAATLVHGRLAVSGTLAADRLDLSSLLPGAPSGEEGRGALSLAAYTRGDLDLRLSAASARLGPLEAEDVAAGLLVRDGAVEATLGRATVQGGTLKGRAALAATPAGLDAKLQGTVDRLDLGALLADLGEPRWILGRVQGTLALESAGGASLAALVARLGGRATAAIEGGEILGLNLAELSQRPETAATALRRGGRTHFERARVTLSLSDGVAEITQGQIRGGALVAGLGGRISLPDRQLGAEVRIEPRTEGRPLAEARPASLFAIDGPWRRPTIRPVAGPRPPAPAIPASASAYAP